ncbi:type II toxin-antitoxin system TacA family antitoxin [Anabaena azotica]|uniref:Uncharacterized protein n=1 Tax=Anabaena azotica FACHB-119 TaxID=947527 RepID=A0ABR8DI47_9NOST|nr:hypothetical protein [Anabaena azotica]MBD2505448.1 hypothetical protein [Anabaena azotica FACHB-119]
MLYLKSPHVRLNFLQKIIDYFTSTTVQVSLQDEEQEAQPYRNDAWVLSQTDAKAFLEVMDNPPAPSKALLSIFE